MKSKSLRMTLLSLSIASLFVPNFAVAENINGEITLDKGQESKTDLVVSKGGHLKGSGDQETNLSVSSAGADNTLEVRQGGQISNFGQVRVDGLTKLTNAKLSDIDELILNNKGNALWINTNSQKYDGTQVSVNNLTVENGNVLIYEGEVKVNQNLEALNSLIQIQKNDATLSVDGTLSAKTLTVGIANSTNTYDVDVGELKVDRLNVYAGADVDIDSGTVHSRVEITDGHLAVANDLTINGSSNSVVVKGGKFKVGGTLTAPYIKFHSEGNGSEATLGKVITNSFWVENSKDKVSVNNLTVNTELNLNAGELTVTNGTINGTAGAQAGSTLKVIDNLTLVGKWLTLNGTYESEGSLTLEKDSAAFVGGSFTANEVIAKDSATFLLQTSDFQAEKVTLSDGELRIREDADNVNVTSVSMSGSQSRIQSWAANATVKSVEASGNSLIELYGLNDTLRWVSEKWTSRNNLGENYVLGGIHYETSTSTVHCRVQKERCQSCC